MEFIRTITKFVGWLSGSLAGITAILYACGYLITRSFLHLLCVGNVVCYHNQEYLQRGAGFFFDLLGILGNLILPLVMFVVIIVVSAMIVNRLVRIFRNRRLDIRVLRFWRDHFREPYANIGNGAGYLVLLVLFFALLFNNLELFSAPLSLSDLLYQNAGELDCRNCRLLIARKNIGDLKQCLRNWVIADNRAELETYLQYLVIIELCAAALFVAAYRISLKWRLHTLFVSPFAVILLMYLALLPAVYGPLMIQVYFPEVRLELKPGVGERSSSPLFLLAKADNAFVTWAPETKELLWIPRSQILFAGFARRASPFQSGARAGEP